MEMAKHAQQVARQSSASDSPMIYLNIGEPTSAPRPWCSRLPSAPSATVAPSTPRRRACPSCASASAPGTPAALAWMPARRIIITAGASAALQLACLALIDEGDEVLMPDPSYPATATLSRPPRASLC